MQRHIQFKYAKDTKHMVKFDEVPPIGTPPIMNNIYIAKWAVGNAREVTVIVDLPDTLPTSPREGVSY